MEIQFCNECGEDSLVTAKHSQTFATNFYLFHRGEHRPRRVPGVRTPLHISNRTIGFPIVFFVIKREWNKNGFGMICYHTSRIKELIKIE